MVTAGGGALESSVENGVGYAQAAVGLQDEAGYQPFTDGWAAYREAHAHLQAGRVDRSLEIFTGLAARTGLAHVLGLCSLTSILALVGRSGEAIAIADDAMNAARAHANPGIIATAYYAYGLAYAVADPHRALNIFREGLVYTRQHQTPFSEAIISREAARRSNCSARASTRSTKPATPPS